MSQELNLDIRSTITESLTETFETMVSMPLTASDREPTTAPGVNRMVGTLSFAGSIIGIFTIQVTRDFARLMAASMLGMETDELDSDEEVKDMLAEVTNIVGGKLKSALNDDGFPCAISTPAITYGSDFSIRSLSMDRFEHLVFEHGPHMVHVEVGLKKQEGEGDGAVDPGIDDQLSKRVDVGVLSRLDYRTKITESALKVFDTMLSIPLEAMDSASIPDPEGNRNAASVCFAGDVTGIINIQVSDRFARKMTARMLDMSTDELEDSAEAEDLLNELSNIIGGSLKSEFSNAGLTCALSTPSFTAGSDFRIESLKLDRFERFAYRHEDNVVLIELGVKISDLVQNAVQDEPAAAENASPTDDPAGPQPKKASTDRLNQEAVDRLKLEAGRDSAAAVPAEPAPPTVDRRSSEPAATAEDFDLQLLLDIPLEITVELGRSRMQIQELLQLAPGSAVKLTKLEGEPVDILANDTLIARGEVVVQNEKYGIRITEITSRMDRIKSLT